MTTYAQIKFDMKNGYEAPTMYDPQCGDFRDVAVKILENYYAKHNLEWQYEASHMTISGEELQEFAELYANEVDTQEINVCINHKFTENINVLLSVFKVFSKCPI